MGEQRENVTQQLVSAKTNWLRRPFHSLWINRGGKPQTHSLRQIHRRACAHTRTQHYPQPVDKPSSPPLHKTTHIEKRLYVSITAGGSAEYGSRVWAAWADPHSPWSAWATTHSEHPTTKRTYVPVSLEQIEEGIRYLSTTNAYASGWVFVWGVRQSLILGGGGYILCVSPSGGWPEIRR